MANFDEDFYDLTEASSDILNRPDATCDIQGQADLLGLAIALNIPLLRGSRNVTFLQNPEGSGSGATYDVSRFNTGFRAHADEDFANVVPDGWFPTDAVRPNVETNLLYVVKSIRIRPDHNFSDAQHLASMVNEMRILSNRSLRATDNVVKLFGVSWDAQPTLGRYWPQLVLEVAELGALDTWLHAHGPSVLQKGLFALDILSGLSGIHALGVVHGDLKPANILIFSPFGDSSERGRFRPFRAKVSDFGSAVILDDYDPGKPFQAKIGTFPWMAPELEHSLPVELADLHKSDLYSFGLVLASIAMNGDRPFDGLTEPEIGDLKLETRGRSAALSVMREVESKLAAPDLFANCLKKVLLLTLQANCHARMDVGLAMAHLKLGMVRLRAPRSEHGDDGNDRYPHDFHTAGARWTKSFF